MSSKKTVTIVGLAASQLGVIAHKEAVAAYKGLAVKFSRLERYVHLFGFSLSKLVLLRCPTPFSPNSKAPSCLSLENILVDYRAGNVERLDRGTLETENVEYG